MRILLISTIILVCVLSVFASSHILPTVYGTFSIPVTYAISLFLSGFIAMICAGWVRKMNK